MWSGRWGNCLMLVVVVEGLKMKNNKLSVLYKPDAAVQLMLQPVDVAALFVTNKISTLFVLMGMSITYLNWYCQ